MKFLASRIGIPFLLTLILSPHGVDAGNELCMRTFKTICKICYDKGDTKQLNSCTFKQCLERDDKDYCVRYGDPEQLDNTTCLDKCCSGSDITGQFTEDKFNECIEYDADRPNDINIGMTLGAMLSLFLLLGLFGAAYLLSILCFDDKLISEGNSPRRQTKPQTEGHLRGSMLVSNDSRWLKGDKIEPRLSGPCIKCKQKNINALTFCKHGYHADCIIPPKGENFECLSCHNSWATINIYCPDCHKNYFAYRLQEENPDHLGRSRCKDCEA